jgi:hypothetical protein
VLQIKKKKKTAESPQQSQWHMVLDVQWGVLDASWPSVWRLEILIEQVLSLLISWILITCPCLRVLHTTPGWLILKTKDTILKKVLTTAYCGHLIPPWSLFQDFQPQVLFPN